MENAVTAKDGHTYSASAIRQWFTIRKSSPMTGLELQDTSLDPDSSVSDAATSWAAGEGIIGRGPPSEQQAKRSRSEDMEVTFDSRYGSFSRRISYQSSPLTHPRYRPRRPWRRVPVLTPCAHLCQPEAQNSTVYFYHTRWPLARCFTCLLRAPWWA